MRSRLVDKRDKRSRAGNEAQQQQPVAGREEQEEAAEKIGKAM
jgi:hypothetical protein